MIHIIGGGLAGSEAAWQAASLDEPVTLYEMRPGRPTPVHQTDRLAELVCSNSFRGGKLEHAVGLLKEEMRRMGSLVMQAADRNRVPAGTMLSNSPGMSPSVQIDCASIPSEPRPWTKIHAATLRPMIA